MGHKNSKCILNGPFDMNSVACLMSQECKVEILKLLYLAIFDTLNLDRNLKKSNL